MTGPVRHGGERRDALLPVVVGGTLGSLTGVALAVWFCFAVGLLP